MTSGRDVAFINTFLALQLTGAALFLLIVLSAIFSRGAKRHRIFFSFCLSWIVFSVSYSLLAFAGQEHKRPGRIICTVQAALIYAAPFLEMGTSLGLIIHLLLNVLSALSPIEAKRKSHPTLLNVLVTLPWVIWMGLFLGILLFGIFHEQQIVMSPNGTYCVVEDTVIPKLTAIGVTIGGTSIISVEFTIATLLYRNRAFANIFGQSKGMAIRILIFTILGFGALSVGIVFAVTTTRGVQFDVIIAVLPPAAALTFGTQKDLMLGWKKRQPPPLPPPPSDQTLVLTSLNYISSQTNDMHPSLYPDSRRTSLSRPTTPVTPVPRPNEAMSFLHF